MSNREFKFDRSFPDREHLVSLTGKDIVPNARYFDFRDYRTANNPYVVSSRHKLIPNCIHCNKPSVVIMDGQKYYDAFQRQSADKKFIFGHLTNEEVEILITGIHPDCWNELFNEGYEEPETNVQKGQ